MLVCCCCTTSCDCCCVMFVGQCCTVLSAVCCTMLHAVPSYLLVNAAWCSLLSVAQCYMLSHVECCVKCAVPPPASWATDIPLTIATVFNVLVVDAISAAITPRCTDHYRYRQRSCCHQFIRAHHDAQMLRLLLCIAKLMPVFAVTINTSFMLLVLPCSYQRLLPPPTLRSCCLFCRADTSPPHGAHCIRCYADASACCHHHIVHIAFAVVLMPVLAATTTLCVLHLLLC